MREKFGSEKVLIHRLTLGMTSRVEPWFPACHKLRDRSGRRNSIQRADPVEHRRDREGIILSSWPSGKAEEALLFVYAAARLTVKLEDAGVASQASRLPGASWICEGIKKQSCVAEALRLARREQNGERSEAL
jgi:hypothetical protein